MALKRYAIWDKTSHVYTPAGEDLTPEANAARRNIMPSALGKLS